MRIDDLAASAGWLGAPLRAASEMTIDAAARCRSVMAEMTRRRRAWYDPVSPDGLRQQSVSERIDQANNATAAADWNEPSPIGPLDRRVKARAPNPMPPDKRRGAASR